ncbi:MAG TPA: hypothetical protein VJ922_07335 [Actinomycetota bacterium]|nr:hypothetical protein [Actinomycetota bacterium]
MSATGTIRIERPFDELAELLSIRPADWLVPFVRIAAYAGEAAAGRSIHIPSPPGKRQISVELFPVAAGDGYEELVVPLRWRTAGFDWVPPSYAGRLFLRGISNRVSEITLDGSYALPASALDQRHALATQVATQATVMTLLRSFQVAVEEQARQTG